LGKFLIGVLLTACLWENSKKAEIREKTLDILFGRRK
jgi:hypothetical protein